MGEFFKGWRRKVAIMTLVLACVFTAGWVRSLTTAEFRHLAFETKSGRGKVLAIATHGGTFDLYWFVEPTEVPDPVDPPISAVVASIDENVNVFGELFHDRLPEIFGEVQQVKIPNIPAPAVARTMTTFVPTFNKIPFWPIVIPLTLLSSWLLLSKPRHLKFATVQPLQQLS